jgi:hypothetical protein
VLRGFARALKPGGRAILDLHDRDALARRVEAVGGAMVGLTERGDDLMIYRVTFDAAAGRSETERIVVRDGQVRRLRFELRMPAASELRDWLLDAGFHTVELFDESGEPYGAGARRLIAVARA